MKIFVVTKHTQRGHVIDIMAFSNLGESKKYTESIPRSGTDGWEFQISEIVVDQNIIKGVK